MSEFNLRCILASGDGDENKGCKLELGFWKWSVYLKLPPLITPTRKKVIPNWDAATIARLGRDYYWDYTELAYGFYLFGSHFNILYGPRTDDSSTEQRWSCFLPFAEWRFVRHSLYDLDGRHFFTQLARNGRSQYDEMTKQREQVPKVVFVFKDFDGEELTATCYIEEREWRFGEGGFKWLSLFRQRKIRRDLELEFSGETGRRKGSWKGGTIGHGVHMLADDSPEWAFRRYCAAHNMTFLRRVEVPRQRIRAA